jgi:2-polyprenyl-3-methyl-5-hydroxy-6-metoxy-1,4-benzoquinol methylase
MSSATTPEILQQKQKVVEKYGAWTAHNIHLGDSVYTISDQIRGDEVLARRILQVVSDVLPMPLSSTRVLDLACLEGLYAIEFAQHGAEAVGIEIREANLVKARFVKELLGLNKLSLSQDDVRNLSLEKYGAFDAVLCLGILYHLDSPDVFDLVFRMAEVCTGCLVIDTHISLTGQVSRTYKGKEYWGSVFTEHDASTTLEERESSLWASIDNVKSFWLTRPSLYNLLGQAGFTSVYECHNPPVFQKFEDRCTILAIKGTPATVLSAQAAMDPLEWSEVDSIAESQPAQTSTLRKVGRLFPGPVKRIARRLVR